MRPITRRKLLRSGGFAGGLGILGGLGAVAGVFPEGSWFRRHLGLTGVDGTVPRVATKVERWSVHSTARARAIDLILTVPVGHDGSELPVCVALHGRNASATGMVDLGVPEFLTAAVTAGTPPFAVVAPDGGEHYWHQDGSGDDPMRMLEEELPGWLAEHGFAGPSAVLGLSMGGFGALSYARRNADVRATAVLSPALFTTWEEVSEMDALPRRAVWEANDPLRRATEYDGSQTAVWCGNGDVFYEAAREFAEGSDAAVASFDAGAHDSGYWHRVLPEAMRFIGNRLS